MRLIDADALNKALGFADPCASCKHVYGMFLCDDAIWQEVCDAIYEAPTIDAVPVVRCKDCEHWDTDWETGDEPVTHFCAMVALRTRGDWFCADGERKAEP